MEPHHWTQAMLLQTLKALAVLQTTATQPRPQRIAMAHPRWTLDTELLHQATRAPRSLVEELRIQCPTRVSHSYA